MILSLPDNSKDHFEFPKNKLLTVGIKFKSKIYSPRSVRLVLLLDFIDPISLPFQ